MFFKKTYNGVYPKKPILGEIFFFFWEIILGEILGTLQYGQKYKILGL